MHASKEIKCEPAMWEKFTEEEKKLWEYVVDGILGEIERAKKEGYGDETVAHNGAMFAVWGVQSAAGKPLVGTDEDPTER